MKEMSAELRNKINSIPALPGIYKMMDSHGNIIYVGKSKCLKNRVKSYFTGTHKWEKVERMVALIRDIDFIVTDTHLEARLLECELIKNIKPIFNSQMKNDRRYGYLQVKDYNPFNPLAVVGERADNAYGPFRSRNLLNELIGFLKNLYPIAFDDNHYTFEYHIFPVIMDRDTYSANQKTLIDLFSDDEKMAQLISQLEDKMKEAAATYKYEAASLYRNMINGLKYVRQGINGYKSLFTKRLVLKLPTDEGIKLFYVNEGQILLTKKYKRLSQLDNYLDSFIKKGNEIKRNASLSVHDKAVIDYRDILYSEISSLTKDRILSINH